MFAGRWHNVGVFKAVMQLFAFLFHAVLALFLFAVATVALASGSASLHLSMLPWTGGALSYALFFGALLGLLTIVLAVRGTLRVLFFLWSLGVLVLLVKGYFLSGYHFAPGEVSTAVYLIIGSLLALTGAWFQMWRRRGR